MKFPCVLRENVVALFRKTNQKNQKIRPLESRAYTCSLVAAPSHVPDPPRPTSLALALISDTLTISLHILFIFTAQMRLPYSSNFEECANLWLTLRRPYKCACCQSLEGMNVLHVVRYCIAHSEVFERISTIVMYCIWPYGCHPPEWEE